MQTVQPSGLLKSILLIDAAASGAMAAGHLLWPGMLGTTLALPGALLSGTGLFLAGYVLLLVGLARSRAVWRALVLFVIAGNVGWAVLSVALLAGGVLVPTGLGAAYVLAQAAGVLGFAALQYRGLGRSAPVAGRGAALA
ncbi:hypothetical protein [Pseudoduganella albidiflava]|uniref:Uncharacterized protein n=2 Tax=Pseudoduganella albidiflava TaxID=321983 RepID=A0AA87Y1T9_9BURK|nr:hypothetical protein [Pseudoduganella albidiflava]GGY64335.1 hypothetical protein GCM10007387_53390 [Pseudoduganella albidiflava]